MPDSMFGEAANICDKLEQNLPPDVFVYVIGDT